MKNKYQLNGHVQFEIFIKHSLDKSLGGNFSISVTDVTQAGVPKNEKTITDEFSFKPVSVTQQNDTLYPIESGISLAGKYMNKKNKNTTKRLTVVEVKEKKIKDGTVTLTDKSGRFWVSGLQHYDTANIGFASLGEKRNSYQIVLDNKNAPPIQALKSNLSFVTKEADDLKKNILTSSLKETMLKEVTISTTREKPVIGNGDYNVPGDLMCKFSSISMALQRSVPGLYFFGGLIRIGPPSSYGSIDPLLIIDGVRTNAGSDGQDRATSNSAGDILLSLNPCSIDRIEIYKYGAAALFGAAGASGVIVVHTKSGSYENKQKNHEIDTRAFHFFKVKGYSTPEEFPMNRARDTTDPPTIFWNPHGVIDPQTGKG
ncbi:MAG: TonB-dependent receptor plug domain-containing protein [Bacteroidetes bacterium]|nr:TonB-dependent receptor plug domain-containing protein [Bacteroidota bacterium]